MGFSRQEYWSGVPSPSPHLSWAESSRSRDWLRESPQLSGLSHSWVIADHRAGALLEAGPGLPTGNISRASAPGRRSGESNSACTEMCVLVFSYCLLGEKKILPAKVWPCLVVLTVIGRAGKDSRRPPYFYLEPAELCQRAPETLPDMSGMAGKNLKSQEWPEPALLLPSKQDSSLFLLHHHFPPSPGLF